MGGDAGDQERGEEPVPLRGGADLHVQAPGADLHPLATLHDLPGRDGERAQLVAPLQAQGERSVVGGVGGAVGQDDGHLVVPVGEVDQESGVVVAGGGVAVHEVGVEGLGGEGRGANRAGWPGGERVG